MKYTKMLTLAFTALLFFSINLKAQTTTQPVDMNVLKAREALLKETTNLNKLNIKLADLNAEIPILEADLNKASEKSARSADESKQLSAKMSSNVGDAKSAKKASKAAKDSYNDAKKTQQITDKLKSTKKKIMSLQADIEKSKAKIAMMDEQLKFTDTLKQ